MVVYLWWGNASIKITEYSLNNSNIPKSFDGFKIAHISDLHDAEFGKNNKRLIKLLEDSKPDIIAVTGDSVDENRPNIDLTLDFFEKAVGVASCYYVTGNHEAGISKEDYQFLESSLENLGVIVLKNQERIIEKNGEKISVLGIDDPYFASRNNKSPASQMSVENLNDVSSFDGYRILLSHRPEYFEAYVEADIDLVLSGHAHGGQIRFPFVGGIVAPDQGFFPKYDGGIYSKENTSMSVSRGLGNSIIPLRINNRPELVIITLKNE